MNGWTWLILTGLVIVILALLLKLYLLKKSAREIKTAFLEKTEQNTNTLIHISSHDADMKALAAAMNTQLLLFHRSRQKFEHGDLELKEAITNISHDLRTPLTAIYGYLKLLKKEDFSGTGQSYLAAIEDRTRALKQLTEELFHYAIAASETEELPLEKLSLNGVLENSISSYYALLTQRGITPQISIPEAKVERMLNENALSRILGNIISNAVKYSDGDLVIVLTEDGAISCSNHAPGLTEVQVGRLFDRFYTVTSARKSTGLGLSIAKLLTERMGGTITALYREEVLEICVSFPLPEADAAKHPSPEARKLT